MQLYIHYIHYIYYSLYILFIIFIIYYHYIHYIQYIYSKNSFTNSSGDDDLEKSTFKLEAHHCHLHLTHCTLENHWFPKSLRLKAPGNHPIFKHIMECTSIHCMKARIAICHEQIRSTNHIIVENQKKLSTLISDKSYYHLTYCLLVRFLSTSCRNFRGYPFDTKALVTCFCSFCFPSVVLSNVTALCRTFCAVLILCCLS